VDTVDGVFLCSLFRAQFCFHVRVRELRLLLLPRNRCGVYQLWKGERACTRVHVCVHRVCERTCVDCRNTPAAFSLSLWEFDPLVSNNKVDSFRFRFFIHHVLQQGKCLESGKHTNISKQQH